MRQWRRLLRRR
uniref:Uncharacterized protein n=1 Tax=Arundo donax TaxID=35708 RepID=A0A0A8Y1A4_ARUDO